MATIKFYCRASDDNRLAKLNVRYTESRELKLRLALPVLIIPAYWNEKLQKFRPTVGNKEFTVDDMQDVADKLNLFKSAIIRERDKLKGKPTTEWLKGIADKFFQVEEIKKPENLNQYIERFLSEAEAGTRLCFNNGVRKNYSAGSLRNLHDFQVAFDGYQGIYTHFKKNKVVKDEDKRPYKPLDFKDINLDFYNKFVAYFYERGCGVNYIGKHLKSLKTMMRQAREEGLHDNQEIEKRAFRAISEPAEHIYLTEEELNLLLKQDLSAKKHHELARDVFLVGCYTAQRYSDYGRITKSMIKEISGKRVIELFQQKTGEKVVIPIRPELETILKKYNYTLPRTHEQKVNSYIKDVAKGAGIKEVVHYERIEGGLKAKLKKFKYELIKTHTARRTGCTLMYLAGISTINIMRISGHKTEKEFLKYIKVTKEETAVNMASHSYFTGKLKVV